MSVTIKTIAEKAGVSKATVSYVINNKAGVGEETREKVLKIIDDLNYKPNSVARGLAGQSTEMIGLIIPDITDMFYADIIRGVELVANKLDYTINLCTTHGEEAKEKKMLEYFSSGRVDGIILMVYGVDNKLLVELKERRIPFVLIDYSQNQDQFCNIVIDNYWGGYKAADYLIGLNHKKIAYIHGIKDNIDDQKRFSGFKEAMAENDLMINKKYIEYGAYTRKGGYQAAKELLSRAELPTAVFAANDQMAIGVINAIQEEGLSVPEDISVIGFDDIEASRLMSPGLTTIRQPTYEMGKLAAEKIFSELKDEESCKENINLKAKLVIRESCAELK